jgi:hypothetical protein
MDTDECGTIGGMLGKGKHKYSEKTYSTAALSTTNPTWPNPGSNPGPPELILGLYCAFNNVVNSCAIHTYRLQTAFGTLYGRPLNLYWVTN